jgi:hypothetical protein
MNFLKALRPVTLDRLAAGSTKPLARLWRTIRSVVFADLVVYWALAIGLILPWALGSGFVFHGGVLAALLASVLLGAFTFICSLLCTLPLRKLGVMVQGSKRELRIQQLVFFLGTGLYFGVVTHWFAGLLAVSGWFAYVFSSAVIWLIALWAYGERPSDDEHTIQLPPPDAPVQ